MWDQNVVFKMLDLLNLLNTTLHGEFPPTEFDSSAFSLSRESIYILPFLRPCITLKVPYEPRLLVLHGNVETRFDLGSFLFQGYPPC